MWDEKNLFFLDNLFGSNKKFDSSEFKKALKSKNLEVNTIDIEYVENLYEQFFSLGHHFHMDDFSRQYFTRYVGSYEGGISLEPKDLIYETVFDKAVYNSLYLLLSENFLEQHIDPICSIIKYGYYYITLAELHTNNKAQIEFDEQFLKLCEFAYSGEEMHSIKFNSNKKNRSVEIKSRPLLNLVTNYLAEMFSRNLNAAGFIDTIKSKARLEMLDIHIRNLTLYKLVFYFQHFTDYKFESNNKGVTISKEQGHFLFKILVEGKVLSETYTDNQSPKYLSAPEPILIRRFLQAIMKKNPLLKRILIELPKIEEIDLVQENEIENFVETYTEKFENKSGL